MPTFNQLVRKERQTVAKKYTAPEGEILVAVEDEKGDRNGCLSSPFKESL